jgi:hypothetical protein
MTAARYHKLLVDLQGRLCPPPSSVASHRIRPSIRRLCPPPSSVASHRIHPPPRAAPRRADRRMKRRDRCRAMPDADGSPVERPVLDSIDKACRRRCLPSSRLSRAFILHQAPHRPDRPLKRQARHRRIIGRAPRPYRALARYTKTWAIADFPSFPSLALLQWR